MHRSTCLFAAAFSAIMGVAAVARGSAALAVLWATACVCSLVDAAHRRQGER